MIRICFAALMVQLATIEEKLEGERTREAERFEERERQVLVVVIRYVDM